MSHIYVYSPSSAVRDRAAVRRGLARLKAMGHEVEMDADAFARQTRFAGDDAIRVAAVHRAAASGADIALTTRGGYGLTRLLPALDFKRIAKAVSGGTKFVGYSDFTALQCGLLARAGAGSWAGPALEGDFGASGEPDEVTLACFDDLALGQGEGAGWRVAAADALGPLSLSGTLWGGNLAVLTALLGTPWMPHVPRGILFLEDTGEHPYRIERMLWQLLHAGVLTGQRAILLGDFGGYRLAPHDRGFRLETVVAWLRQQVRAAVLTRLPFGHVPTKLTLPFGRKVQLVLENRDAWLVWGPGR